MNMPIWRRLFKQLVRWDLDLARLSAGKSIAARIAMIAITTSSSIRVKAERRVPHAVPVKELSEALEAKFMEFSVFITYYFDLFNSSYAFLLIAHANPDRVSGYLCDKPIMDPSGVSLSLSVFFLRFCAMPLALPMNLP